VALLGLVTRRWVWVACALLVLSTVVLAVSTTGGYLTAAIVYTLAAVVGTGLPFLAWRVIMSRYRAAFEREDAAALLTLARALEPSLRGFASSARLSAMMVDERHDEVRASCEAALAQTMSRPLRAQMQNALAWATALAGDAEAAIPIAEAAVTDSAALPSQRALCIGTLGIALHLAERPTEALAHLDTALSMGGTPRAQAIRHFYRGEALRSLGRAEESRAAYACCIATAPSSRWTTRARAARDTLGVAYR
jgi:tetratricopeptide (TPR) repeat protein